MVRKEDRYTSHDIQNEIIAIMANHVIIRSGFFSIICDEYTDISNMEQLTIKDVLLKLQLSLVNCRGQCFDGANNMMGHKTGLTKRIQDLQPRAYPTHGHGHSLSLSVKDTTKNLLGETRKPRRP